MRKYLSILLTIIFLTIFLIYFAFNFESFKSLHNVSPLSLIAISLLQLAAIYLNGVFVKVILSAFNKRISTHESFYLSILSTIGNYFTPMRGGAGIRAVYLKKKFQFKYSYFLATLSGNYILVFLLNSFIALISLVLIHTRSNIYSITLYIFFTALFATTLFLSIFKLPENLFKKQPRILFISKILSILHQIAQGWNFIIQKKDLMIKLLLITSFNFISLVITSYLEFLSIGISLSIYNIILYSCLSGISLLISLTPGSLGIREGIFILFSDIIGINNKQILQVAVIDRGVLFFVLILLFILVKLLRRNMHKTAQIKKAK